MEQETLDPVDQEVKAPARERLTSEPVRRAEKARSPWPRRLSDLRGAGGAGGRGRRVVAGFARVMSPPTTRKWMDTSSRFPPKFHGNIAEVLVDDNQQVKQGPGAGADRSRAIIRPSWIRREAALVVAESQAQGATRQRAAHARHHAAAELPALKRSCAAAKAHYDQAQLDYERASTTDIAVGALERRIPRRPTTIARRRISAA